MSHADRFHARYSASRAARDMACPGNQREAARWPRRLAGPAAERGTRLHETLEMALRTGMDDVSDILPDALEADAVNTAIKYVKEIVGALSNPQVLIEKYMPFPQDAVPRDQCGGTADAVIYCADTRRAWVVDAKFGKFEVEADNNPQVLFYATAALWDVPVSSVTIAIVQPDAPSGRPVKEWTVSGADLAEFQAAYVEALQAAQQPDAPTVAGEHCRFCDAEPFCEAKRAAALAVARADLSGFTPPDPHDMEPAWIRYVLEHGSAMTSWIKAVREHAEERARIGQPIPGTKLVAGRARREWTGDPWAVVRALAELAPHLRPWEDILVPTLLPIGDAEKAVTKAAVERGLDPKPAKDKLAFYMARRPAAGATLVLDKDPRPAVNPASDFTGVLIAPPEEKSK